VTSDIGFLPALTRFPEIKAGFTTRQGGDSSPPFDALNLGFFSGDQESTVAANWQRTLFALGFHGKSLVLPRMVHGTWSQEVNQAGLDQGLIPTDSRANLSLVAPRECDAVFTQDAAFVLSVTMADCMPILVYDPTTQCRAAIHAGWRGTRDHIVGKCLTQLFQRGLAKPGTTWVCLGPAISGRRLELGPEVMAHVDPRFAVCWSQDETTKQGMDMAAWNRRQALDLGVPSSQIECVERCTYNEPRFFFSYRRDGIQSGRMAALIGTT
jgi:polyphenol oxidase